jgi:AcrR family transcriptional regulator
MGIKERQERDREAVRRAILDAAKELFVREGYQNVSIRKIAELVEYSPAAIYSYFPSKDDIFFAIAEEGFQLLYGDRTQFSELETLRPVERLRAIFWGFYQFSCKHPQYFALMFVDRSVPRVGREYERFSFAREMKAHLIAQVQQCQEEGVFPPDVVPSAIFRVLTAGLVGVAVLRMSDRLAPGEDPDELARDVLDVTIAGLRSGVALRSQSVACEADDHLSSGADTRVAHQESHS